MFVAGTDIHRVGECQHLGRRGLVGCLSGAELAIGAIAPAIDFAVLHQRAAVRRAQCQLDHAGAEADYCNRCGLDRGCAYTKLAGGTGAPAIHRAAAGDGTGMCFAACDRAPACYRRADPDRRGAVDCAAVAELAAGAGSSAAQFGGGVADGAGMGRAGGQCSGAGIRRVCQDE